MANYPTLSRYANMQVQMKEAMIDGHLFVGHPVEGKDIYVSSVTGGAASNGQSPANAVLTITAGLALCTANQGDRVICLPGHTETLTAAAGIVLSVAGVSIIGLGVGSQRPTINFGTATTTTITVTAANVSVFNMRFLSTFADVVTAFDVTAAGFAVENCEFGDSAIDLNLLSAVKCTSTSDGNANGLRLVNNKFLSQDAATLGFVIIAADILKVTIEDNVIVSEGTGLATIFTCLTGKDIRMCSVQRNYLSSKATAGNLGYSNDTASPNNSGIIANNYIGHADVTAGHVLGVVGGCRMFNNLSVSTDALSGFVIPAIDVDS